MIWDEYGVIAMEDGTYPGTIGDSCAETCRYLILKHTCGYDMSYDELTMAHDFMTDKGFVRHPNAPFGPPISKDSWREDDFTSDQAVPLYIAGIVTCSYTVSLALEKSIRAAGWRTGNGDYITPTLYGLINTNRLIVTLSMIGSALLFKLPWRWNDEKKAFESSKNSSCDYLNWIVCIPYAHPLVTKVISKKKAILKVIDYYQDEPNAFVLPLYIKFIEKMWSR